jgi:hypothetical protein
MKRRLKIVFLKISSRQLRLSSILGVLHLKLYISNCNKLNNSLHSSMCLHVAAQDENIPTLVGSERAILVY